MELKELRDKYGITEDDMAKMMGMSTGNYQRLERGRRKLTLGHKATVKLIERVYRIERGFW